MSSELSEIKGQARESIKIRNDLHKKIDEMSKFEQEYEDISDYINSSDKNCFLVHFSGSDAVYGLILDHENISYPESQLLYTILGLDKSNFPTTYSTSTSYGYYGGGSSHYHTVVPDRDTLARTDPGAYYDHYEYGDNYDIDDYLESEGYD